MKESERLKEMAKEARIAALQCVEAESGKSTPGAAGFTVSASILELARQIAITREEAQNGRPSPFDRK